MDFGAIVIKLGPTSKRRALWRVVGTQTRRAGYSDEHTLIVVETVCDRAGNPVPRHRRVCSAYWLRLATENELRAARLTGETQ